MKLYKYRRIDDYTIASIRDSTLWFSSPADFNDPYDCRLSMDSYGTKEEWENFLREGFIPDPIIRDLIDRRQIHNDLDLAIHKLQAIMEEVRHSLCVCCFSQLNNSIPMWSHYADGHKGICLEFDSEKDTKLQNIFDVNYCESFPSITIRNTKEEIMKKLVTSKAKAWNYESECRIFARGEKGLTKVDRRSMTGVIFGCSCPLQDKEKVINELRAYVPVPKLYKANTKIDKYEVVIVECSEK